jgi:hypothetical protein
MEHHFPYRSTAEGSFLHLRSAPIVQQMGKRQYAALQAKNQAA